MGLGDNDLLPPAHGEGAQRALEERQTDAKTDASGAAVLSLLLSVPESSLGKDGSLHLTPLFSGK